MSRVCRVWEIARSTVYWKRHHNGEHGIRKRPGPCGPCLDEDLVEQIKRVIKECPFHAEGYRKVWARLRFRGIRTSKRRVLRLMRQEELLAPHRAGNRHGPKGHDGTIITVAVDEMWGTDMTAAFTSQEGPARIFVAVDHCSCECVGIHASKSGNRFEALEPIRQGMRRHFGAYGQGVAFGLKLRHDHGSQYMSDDFQSEIRFLGIESSPAFVREPEGNGCAERFIRTLKENLLWVRSFDTIEELRIALLEFMHLYNNEWLIERHGNKTPSQVRREKLTMAKTAA
jgi:putative transposase